MIRLLGREWRGTRQQIAWNTLAPATVFTPEAREDRVNADRRFKLVSTKAGLLGELAAQVLRLEEEELAGSSSGGRLLLREAVQRAQPPHQVYRVDAHDRAVAEELGQHP